LNVDITGHVWVEENEENEEGRVVKTKELGKAGGCGVVCYICVS